LTLYNVRVVQRITHFCCFGRGHPETALCSPAKQMTVTNTLSVSTCISCPTMSCIIWGDANYGSYHVLDHLADVWIHNMNTWLYLESMVNWLDFRPWHCACCLHLLCSVIRTGFRLSEPRYCVSSACPVNSEIVTYKTPRPLPSQHLNERRGRVVDTPTSYLGGPGFDSRSRRPASDWGFVVFSVPPGECRDITLKLGHYHLLPNPLQFIPIHLPSYYRHCISLV
jgi:hypothetical protein